MNETTKSQPRQFKQVLCCALGLMGMVSSGEAQCNDARPAPVVPSLMFFAILAFATPALAASAEPPIWRDVLLYGPSITIQPDLRPSFSCKKAKTIVEQLICSDRNLANLDRRMWDIYTAARTLLTDEEKMSVLKTQREWLAGHDQACGITPEGEYVYGAAECLIKRYLMRTEKLQAMLSRGNVIRELGGSEPWTENTERYGMSENRVTLLQRCVGEELEEQVNSCCAPGTETIEETASTITAYVINGKRFLLYNGKYSQRFNIPRYAGCYDEVNEKGELVGCPDNTTYASCAALFAETERGNGDFAFADHRWNFPVSMDELLIGKSKDQQTSKEFTSELHSKLLEGEIVTLVTSKGKISRFQWDAGKMVYVRH
ncbi:MAG: lysozyme inhibitor LprI family protein [Gallionella sp.]